MPLSIEVTAYLVELDLSGGENRSENELRLMYSMTILRFVNGLVDPIQKKAHAMSLTTLAKVLNLPRIFVDLRHQSSHNQLASLPMLKYAAEQVCMRG